MVLLVPLNESWLNELHGVLDGIDRSAQFIHDACIHNLNAVLLDQLSLKFLLGRNVSETHYQLVMAV
jgi:hypothetical protein